MKGNLGRLVKSSKKVIKVADDLLMSCHQETIEKYTHSKAAISFFLRRSSEMFESFLVLIKKNRIIDSALLLRSFLEMGITLGYIVSKEINETESEKRAFQFLIEGNDYQLRLANSNREGFRRTDKGFDKRISELNGQLEELKTKYREQFGEEYLEFPCIEQRAIRSEYEIFRNIYDQSYRLLSSIEHHSFFFGQNYVEIDNCRPIRDLEHLKHHPELKLGVSLFLFKSIYIEILNAFNDIHHLGREKQIAGLRILQEAEFRLLKE